MAETYLIGFPNHRLHNTIFGHQSQDLFFKLLSGDETKIVTFFLYKMRPIADGERGQVRTDKSR